MRARLDPAELLAAYAEGWFPMDIDGRVGLYECDPRAVVPVGSARVPRSVARAERREGFEIRLDTAFAEVVAACGGPRSGEWLTPRLADAYLALHRIGVAHSVESWRGGRLAGGLFGVALGGLFTSESMFHREGDAGNAALAATVRLLRRAGFVLWDVQMWSGHVGRFGAVNVSPDEYRERLAAALAVPAVFPSGP